jgi:elongation factor 1 alpha-like protein
MITGTSQADCAILVVPAAQAEFERGWSEQGQTREHALLARSLGVSQLIVAVNKMDVIEWEKTRFDVIKEQLGGFLKRSGFKEENLWFVPVSGLTGENLTKRKEPKLTAWYDGPTLLERVDQFAPPEREVDKPFRLTVNDIFRESGLSIGGKVETGFFSVGDKLVCLPYGDPCVVKSIRFNGQPVDYAAAGANVDVTLNGIEQTSITIGSVLCDPEQPIQVTKRFKAQILTFALEVPLMRGQRLLLHTQNLNEPARLVALHGIMEKGEIKKAKPRAVSEKQTALVEIATDHNICAELYSNIRSLGRFMLRQEGRTVAGGLITEFVDPTTVTSSGANSSSSNSSQSAE